MLFMFFFCLGVLACLFLTDAFASDPDIADWVFLLTLGATVGLFLALLTAVRDPTPYTLPPTAPQMERRFAPEPPPARDPRRKEDEP
jgi:hypothetical protein